MRLTGWQRLGIALSVVWALGAGIYTRNADVERADHFAKFAYKVCSDSKSLAHDTDLSSCAQEREKNLETWMKGSDANVAVVALAPIPFGWLTAFILLYVARAQVVGFRAVVPWAALNRPKKAFVVFCALASLAAVLFGLTVVFNLYVDTQVPVALSPFVTVIKTGDNWVTAEGTWTRSGSTEGSSIGNPLQTSRIACNKEQRRCTEVRALVSGNVLIPELVEYDVESWTAAAIVLRLDAACVTEVFTVDLNTKSVSGAGHSTKRMTSIAKSMEARKKAGGISFLTASTSIGSKGKKPDHWCFGSYRRCSAIDGCESYILCFRCRLHSRQALSGKRLKDFAKSPPGLASRNIAGGAFCLASQVGLALQNTSPVAPLLGVPGHKI